MDDVIVSLLPLSAVPAWMGAEVRVAGRRAERLNLVRSAVLAVLKTFPLAVKPLHEDKLGLL